MSEFVTGSCPVRVRLVSGFVSGFVFVSSYWCVSGSCPLSVWVRVWFALRFVSGFVFGSRLDWYYFVFGFAFDSYLDSLLDS